MKAEINNENKAKFFALYFNQYIGRNPLNGNSKSYVNQYFLNVSGIGCASYLELKPLSQISDEDAIEVARIAEYDDQIARRDDRIFLGKEEVLSIETDGTAHKNSLVTIHISDYLRSKGYALPWMGLSVEDLINAGWIRLLD